MHFIFQNPKDFRRERLDTNIASPWDWAGDCAGGPLGLDSRAGSQLCKTLLSSLFERLRQRSRKRREVFRSSCTHPNTAVLRGYKRHANKDTFANQRL